METIDKNASGNTPCPHRKTLETRHVVNREVVTVRRCTRCREVVPTYRTHGQINFPAPGAAWGTTVNATVMDKTPPTIEDAQTPNYWDCSPDLNDLNGIETFRKLGWAIVAFAIFFVLVANGAIADFK